MKRPTKTVLDVCAERFDDDGAGREWAAAQIVNLRELVRQAQGYVPHETVEQQRWHSDAARRLVRVKP